MKGQKPSKRKSIYDFFKPEVYSDEEEENKDQSTSANVQNELKCPKRKVLEDEEDDEITAKKKRAVRKSGGGAAVMKDLGRTQMVLDCGQQVIGTTVCKDCKMMYSVDAVEDVRAHEKFHLEWKYRFEIPKEYVEMMLFYNRELDSYKVYYVATFTTEKLRNLLSSHMKEINKLIGYVDEKDDLWSLDKRVFLIICDTNDRMLIGGIVVVEKIKRCFTNVSRKEIVSEDDVNDWICGVDRIWVDPSCRKKGVAYALLDAATTQDRMMNYRPRRLRIAFSDPTDDGIQLAKRFTSTRYLESDQYGGEILVY